MQRVERTGAGPATGHPATVRRADLVAGTGLALVGAVVVGAVVVGVIVLDTYLLIEPWGLAVGASLLIASLRAALPRAAGLCSVVVGSVLVAVGIGSVPHLLEEPTSLAAVSSVVFVLGGLVASAVGLRAALAGRRLIGRAVGSVAAVSVLLLVIAAVAPAIAANDVPATSVSATPDAVGLPFESVTLRTDDGVDLAAWYLAGESGAAVVVLHGAGSTRSDVLDEVAVLVRHGYSVLVPDARGHGDSGGRAMDFGWFGDLDVAAAVDDLARRPGVDPGRVGVVGFSMGGEEAIGATAADPRIRAVVAEGATARVADDKGWLSDQYGVRGWLQEQVEHVQYGITDLLTDAAPPTSLRSAVAHAHRTQFLLITAGTLDDEAHAAAHIRSAAPDRVEVWTVADAGHVGGLETQPDEWVTRVVGFLDEQLS